MAAFYTFLFFILTVTLYVAVKGDCGQQPDIAHGYPDRVDLSYVVGSTVSYTCETGYEFRAQNSTEMTITCEEGDTWSPVTNCQVKSCPLLPSDAVLSSVNTSYGAEVQISCAHSNERIPGVAVGDSLFTVCQENKTWSYWDQTQEEACVEIACEYPMENSFGDALTATSGSPGDLAQFTCFDKYFYRDGSNQKWFMCNAAGLWEANFQSGGPTTAEKCNPKVCPSLIKTYFLEHIIVEPAIQFADQEVALICEPGYEFNDTSTEQSSFCFGGNLTWSFIPFNCQEKVCEPVLYLEYGNASTSDNWYGSEVNYTCNTGYWFPNGDTARVSVCNEHGKWSEVIPQCTDEKIEIDSGFSNTVTNADLGERFIYIAIGIISTVLVMVIVFDILTFPRQISFLKMNLRSRFSRFRESEELDVKSVDGEALMRSSMISLASGRGKITPAPQRIDQVDTTQEKQASSILISQDSRV